MAPIRFDPPGLLAAAQWTRDRLVKYGVRQPPGNRLHRAQAFIKEVDERPLQLKADDHGLLTQVTEALWTIVEQYVVARALGQPMISSVHREKLGIMLSGADTEDEDQNPIGRNTQFELYVGGTLVMGDVGAWFDEPDIRFEYFGAQVGVAAKRVRSSGQLVRRAKEAVAQLRRSGSPGFVALNVDVIFKTVGGDPTSTEMLDERLAAVRQVDEELSRHTEVIGSLIFARDSCWEFGGSTPRILVSSTHRFSSYPRMDDDKTRGEQFWRAVTNRIDERLGKL